jgi:hypothetical protein
MGMIRSDAKGPTPEQAAALKEAAERGSFSNEKKFREEIAALQDKRPAAQSYVGVAKSPAEGQFESDLATIAQMADTTLDPQFQDFARATHRMFSYLVRKR